ncbi:unannotated protein [freshwater metagenome]|uniref:Unannotated protein n=1 Tax=freshwater metagenome TaxID=449393 RepID=A0A6J6RY81_9ZZZZ
MGQNGMPMRSDAWNAMTEPMLRSTATGRTEPLQPSKAVGASASSGRWRRLEITCAASARTRLSSSPNVIESAPAVTATRSGSRRACSLRAVQTMRVPDDIDR